MPTPFSWGGVPPGGMTVRSRGFAPRGGSGLGCYENLCPHGVAHPERASSRLLCGLPVAGGTRAGSAPRPGQAPTTGSKAPNTTRPRTTVGTPRAYRAAALFSSDGVPRSGMTAPLEGGLLRGRVLVLVHGRHSRLMEAVCRG